MVGLALLRARQPPVIPTDREPVRQARADGLRRDEAHRGRRCGCRGRAEHRSREHGLRSWIDAFASPIAAQAIAPPFEHDVVANL